MPNIQGLPPRKEKAMAERSDALKKAQQKYMERFAVARVRMERKKYEAVQSYAEARDMSVNALVVDLLDQAMERDSAGTPTGATGAPTGAGGVSLPSDTIKAAQEAAEAAGEAVPVFIARAVETQAQMDEIGRKMKGGKANE